MERIYISSTYEDLKDMREGVYHALRTMGHDVIAMEDLIATDKRPLDKCLADVSQCDIYIGIYAWRYGYIPPDQEKSITELEYREAVRTKKPCLLFLLDEEAPWPTKLTDTDRTRIEAFHNELRENYTVSFFQDVNDLKAKVITAMEKFGRKIEPGPEHIPAEPEGAPKESIIPQIERERHEMMTPSEKDFFQALEDEEHDWRTIRGLLKASKMTEKQVHITLDKYNKYILKSAIPDINGNDLYTLRSLYKKRKRL